jgi:hypothetical protein
MNVPIGDDFFFFSLSHVHVRPAHPFFCHLRFPLLHQQKNHPTSFLFKPYTFLNITLMVLEDPTSDESTQVVRRVYENEDLNTTASLSKVFRLECHFDDVSGKSIILWDDILAAFKGVVHVRVGERILPFLKGRNFKT